MTCGEFRRLVVEDDRPEESLREHARDCAACSRILEAEVRLSDAVHTWKARTDAPPAGLEARIVEAWTRESTRQSTGLPRRRRRPSPARWRPTPAVTWLAAAATVVVVVLAVLALPRSGEPDVRSVSGELLVADALAEAQRAERAHAEAIARLSEAARPILARASDPQTPPAEAALLRSYRDRLASLDDAIADVQSFLDGNPGHPGARTVLLAAYMDKTELLGEILALDEEENA